MGAMMAMGAGLNDYERAGYARPRERYERWCAMRGFGARLANDTSPTPQELAESKRARKAAKRRRDAERTEEGKRNDLWWAMYDHAIEQSREVAP